MDSPQEDWSSVDEEGAPMLESINEKGCFNKGIGRQTSRRPHQYLYYHLAFWLGYTAIFAIALSLVISHKSAPNVMRDKDAGLYGDALRYERRVVNYNFDDVNPYRGQSLDDIEDNWTELLNGGSTLLLPQQQMDDMNLTSIKISDGTERHIVKPTSYHMLHCLYNMYRYAHPDYYGEDAGGKDWVTIHTDHCIDNLRQFVMCHRGDGMSTWMWLNKRKMPWPVLSTEETCVAWPEYDGWVREHSASENGLRTGNLVHPTLGVLGPEDWISKHNVHTVHSPSDFD